VSDTGRIRAVLSEQAETIATVATRAGVSRRDAEFAIAELRLAGLPIVGDGEGVRLTSDPAELRAYAASRRRRLVQVALGTRQLLRTARRLEDEAASRQGLTLFGDVA
jgi:predicted DNA-binding transcriptional regulator YafY